jgi:cell shape-determining protein MreC
MNITSTNTNLDDRTEMALENQRLAIENENLKNILNGLNEKLTVRNDLKSDVEHHKKMYNESEQARLNLHTKLN